MKRDPEFTITADNGSFLTVQAELRTREGAKFVPLVVPRCSLPNGDVDLSKTRRHLQLRAAEVVIKDPDPTACISCGPIFLTKDPDFAKGAKA